MSVAQLVTIGFMTATQKSERIKRLARSLGFERCGIAPASRVSREDYFRTWLQSGRAGEMHYLQKYFDQRVDPSVLLEGARSVIVVALNYHQPGDTAQSDCSAEVQTGSSSDSPRGRVAQYAWGDDYHTIIKQKLFTLADSLKEQPELDKRQPENTPVQTKVCVDTAPLLERELAAAAGVGWIGKNTMVIHPQLGSYFFLGAVVTTLALEPDQPMADHCGTCTACLEACPTQAFPAPYEMDASRCISYLTIEHRSDINKTLQSAMGDWIFGCDICQEVCPHNHHAPTTQEAGFAKRPPGPTPALQEILQWTPQDYREQLRGSAMKRAKLDMLQRNATIALTNLSRQSPSPLQDH